MKKPTTTKSTKVKTGRVSSISVSRLYNLGNYQNVKYDLTCEVPRGASAEATLLEIVRIIRALGPIRSPECLPQLESAREKSLTERSEYQKAHFHEWLAEETSHRMKLNARMRAVHDLDRLGGVATYTDHKMSWQDDDWDTPF